MMNSVCPIILIKHMRNNNLWNPGFGCGSGCACATVVHHSGHMGEKEVVGGVRNKTAVWII